MEIKQKKGIMSAVIMSMILLPISITLPIKKILNHLIENKESYPLKISSDTGIDYKNLFRYLERLEENNIIEKESSGTRGKKVKIKLNQKFLNQQNKVNK